MTYNFISKPHFLLLKLPLTDTSSSQRSVQSRHGVPLSSVCLWLQERHTPFSHPATPGVSRCWQHTWQGCTLPGCRALAAQRGTMAPSREEHTKDRFTTRPFALWLDNESKADEVNDRVCKTLSTTDEHQAFLITAGGTEARWPQECCLALHMLVPQYWFLLSSFTLVSAEKYNTEAQQCLTALQINMHGEKLWKELLIEVPTKAGLKHRMWVLDKEATAKWPGDELHHTEAMTRRGPGVHNRNASPQGGQVPPQALQAHGLPILTDSALVLPRARQPGVAGQAVSWTGSSPEVPSKLHYSRTARTWLIQPCKTEPRFVPRQRSGRAAQANARHKGMNKWLETDHSEHTISLCRGLFPASHGKEQKLPVRLLSAQRQLYNPCLLFQGNFTLRQSPYANSSARSNMNQNEHSHSISEHDLSQLVNEAQNADKGRKGNAK